MTDNEMNYEQICQDNEMIARFMGLKRMKVWIERPHEYSSNEIELVTEQEIGWGREGNPYGYEINYDGDLLVMFEVLDKITKTNNPFNSASHTINLEIAHNNKITIKENFYSEVIVRREGENLKAIIYDTIVSFVKWFNKNK